jgi:hypothetical protein
MAPRDFAPFAELSAGMMGIAALNPSYGSR